SHPLDKAIHHPLLPRLVELDGELVAVDGGDVAVAEFLVEDAVADRELGDGAGGFGDELAFDGARKARARLAARACVHAPSLAPTRGRGPCRVVHRSIAIGITLAVVIETAMAEPAPRLRALPAGRAVARAEMGHLVEARAAGIAVSGKATFGFRHLHVRLRQFVEEARGDIRRPQPMHAPVG